MINWTTKKKIGMRVCVCVCHILRRVVTFISGAKNTLILQIFELVKRNNNMQICPRFSKQNEIMSYWYISSGVCDEHLMGIVIGLWIYKSVKAFYWHKVFVNERNCEDLNNKGLTSYSRLSDQISILEGFKGFL